MAETINREGKGDGCACVAHDPRVCSRLRYSNALEDDGDALDEDDVCECLCHTWPTDDDEYDGE